MAKSVNDSLVNNSAAYVANLAALNAKYAQQDDDEDES